MKRKNQFALFGSLVVGTIFFGLLFTPRKDFMTQFNEMKENAAMKVDEINDRIYRENRFYDSIQYLITSGNLNGADSIVDKLLEGSPYNNEYLTFKGRIFNGRKMYDSALYYYGIVIAKDPYPTVLDKRARTFLKLNRYKDAIKDYRKAYEQNDEFCYQLARTFELNTQKDSALKYYNIYLEHYPDSLYKSLRQQGIYLNYPPDSVRLRISKLKRK